MFARQRFPVEPQDEACVCRFRRTPPCLEQPISIFLPPPYHYAVSQVFVRFPETPPWLVNEQLNYLATQWV
jgi:hypothetical protein